MRTDFPGRPHGSPHPEETALRVAVLATLVDDLDLYAFLNDPAYRRRLNEVLSAFSDDEFDTFEWFYNHGNNRFTIN